MCGISRTMAKRLRQLCGEYAKGYATVEYPKVPVLRAKLRPDGLHDATLIIGGKEVVRRGVNCTRPELVDSFDSRAPVGVDKALVNSKLVATLSEYGPDRKVLYLESMACLTSVVLAAAGFPKRQLLVPHPSPRHPPKGAATFAAVAKKADRLFTWVDGMLYDAIRDDRFGRNLEANVFLDYCCTFSGTDAVKPAIDIELLLAKGVLPRRGGVFAATFSTRGVGVKRTQDALNDLLTTLGKRHGYDFHPLWDVQYKPVATFVYATGDKRKRVRAAAEPDEEPEPEAADEEPESDDEAVIEEEFETPELFWIERIVRGELDGAEWDAKVQIPLKRLRQITKRTCTAEELVAAVKKFVPRAKLKGTTLELPGLEAARAAYQRYILKQGEIVWEPERTPEDESFAVYWIEERFREPTGRKNPDGTPVYEYTYLVWSHDAPSFFRYRYCVETEDLKQLWASQPGRRSEWNKGRCRITAMARNPVPLPKMGATERCTEGRWMSGK